MHIRFGASSLCDRCHRAIGKDDVYFIALDPRAPVEARVRKTGTYKAGDSGPFQDPVAKRTFIATIFGNRELPVGQSMQFQLLIMQEGRGKTSDQIVQALTAATNQAVREWGDKGGTTANIWSVVRTLVEPVVNELFGSANDWCMGEVVVSIEHRPTGLVMSIAPGRDAHQIRTDKFQFTGKNVNYKMQFWVCYENTPPMSNRASVEYMVHESGIGDVPWVRQGTTCGTTGQSRAIEGIAIRSSTVDLQYRGHIAYQGDTGYVRKGGFLGTRGISHSLESLAIELLGESASTQAIYYRAHLANYGWTEWFSNGLECGTIGQGRAIEAVEIFVADR